MENTMDTVVFDEEILKRSPLIMKGDNPIGVMITDHEDPKMNGPWLLNSAVQWERPPHGYFSPPELVSIRRTDYLPFSEPLNSIMTIARGPLPGYPEIEPVPGYSKLDIPSFKLDF